MSRLIAILLASALALSAGSLQAADATKEKADFQRRLDSVKTMTSALQRDNDAATPAVREVLAAVSARQKEAEELAAVGEYGVASTILDEGYKKLTATLMKAKSGEGYQQNPVSGDGQPLPSGKARADYERKLASASTMLDAAKRGDAGNSQLAAIEATIGKAKTAATAGDFAAANQLIDDAMSKTRQIFVTSKSDAATAKLKSGSATLDRDFGGLSGEEKKAETSKMLRSATSLRDLLARRSQEKGIDNGPTLSKIEQQIGDARRLESSDPNRALQQAASAYEAAKAGIESLRSK